MTTLPRRATVAALAAAVPLLIASGTAQGAPATYTHEAAAREFRAAGVSWTSSKNCSDRRDSGCTSFTGINRATVSGAIAFKRTSRCPVIITGGTEAGHSPRGQHTHGNGYKVDMSLAKKHENDASCLDVYITRHYAKAGTRGDGAALYKSPAGNVYARERSHWDVTYLNGRA
ncbi:hypothetical protein AB0469_03330 [Streptomyces sp. NPDC093801]|uniref:hypothetical protein n=1 Tax=Streptomyces sp. NPDC093801 TaxID=3155203 RepID=UPI00344DDB66